MLLFQFDLNLAFQAGDVLGWWMREGVISYDQLSEEAGNRNYCIGRQRGKRFRRGNTVQLDWSDNGSDTSISYRDFAMLFYVEYNCV